MEPDVRHSVATLARLRREISEDRRAMEGRAVEIEEARPHLDQRPWTSFAAVAVHGWYTTLEAALERIARVLDGDVPSGDRWHRELLSQATVAVPGVRPAVVARELLPELLELLAFRHFFRHAYGVAVDPTKLAVELDRVRRIAPGIEAGLDRLDTHLDEAVESLTSGDP